MGERAEAFARERYSWDSIAPADDATVRGPCLTCPFRKSSSDAEPVRCGRHLQAVAPRCRQFRRGHHAGSPRAGLDEAVPACRGARRGREFMAVCHLGAAKCGARGQMHARDRHASCTWRRRRSRSRRAASSLTIVLCGIEAWQPITFLQRAALDRATRLIAISSFTREGFRRANPHFADRDIDVCHLGVEPFDDLGPLPAGARQH